jgi:hypothetical protein
MENAFFSITDDPFLVKDNIQMSLFLRADFIFMTN